jgi:putative lipoic acid-binding regulatory protein
MAKSHQKSIVEGFRRDTMDEKVSFKNSSGGKFLSFLNLNFSFS